MSKLNILKINAALASCLKILNKIVETGKTDDKCNNPLKHSCYACYQDYCFPKLNMLITTIGIITIGTGESGTIFGIEIVMIKRTSIFLESTRDNTHIQRLTCLK